VESLYTVFSLRHKELGCYLGSSGERLPEWGFSQLEVVCTLKRSRRTEWNIEQVIVKEWGKENDSPATAKPLERKSYDWSFFLQDFIDLNVAMWYGNNALVPKVGKKDMLISSPSQWAFMETGLRMCNWQDTTIKYYLLGNPIVWWMSTCAILLFVTQFFYYNGKWQLLNGSIAEENRYVANGCIILIGWLLHYLPFWIMGRVTYLHHYFPSLVFSVMMTAHILNKLDMKVAISVLFLVVFTFFYFSPLSYGFIGEASLMKGRVWRGSWNIF